MPVYVVPSGEADGRTLVRAKLANSILRVIACLMNLSIAPRPPAKGRGRGLFKGDTKRRPKHAIQEGQSLLSLVKYVCRGKKGRPSSAV